MLSVMPAEMVAQAVSVAVRTASSSVVPEAVAQFLRPWKSMQTSQVNCRSPIEKYTTATRTAATNSTAAKTGFLIPATIVPVPDPGRPRKPGEPR